MSFRVGTRKTEARSRGEAHVAESGSSALSILRVSEVKYLVTGDLACPGTKIWYSLNMKLLLTSAGITNETIANALEDLAGKSIKESKILFIPTAANTGTDDKSWLVQNIYEFTKREPLSFDLIDIAGLPDSMWKKHFEVADVICFGGGDEAYLSRILDEQNITEYLKPLLEKKVYMGISAGSLVAGIFQPKGINVELYGEECENDEGIGMEFYDFVFIPHLNSPYFPNVIIETLEEKRDRFVSRVIATDDFTAIKIVDGEIEFVGDGDRWEKPE